MIEKKKQIEYEDKVIEYILIKDQIKNLYIRIKEGRVIVKAPIRMNERQIEEIIKQKAKWIVQHSQEGKKTIDNSYKTEENKYRLEQKVEKIITNLALSTSLVPNKWRVRDIQYAWGSCSSKKNITISLRLITKTEGALTYVILHELCHLKYMNHSKYFWQLLENYMPDYKKYRKELRS